MENIPRIAMHTFNNYYPSEAAMLLRVNESLSSLVARRFEAAKEGDHLLFSPTHLSIVNSAGIPFQLRYCPALAKKPSNLKPENEPKLPKQPKFDPFKDPSPELLIASFPSHALVLNKFPVIPNHFIITTKEWKAQTDLLEKTDLQATYECLQIWDDDGKTPRATPPTNRLFAFFNSGDESGASQPHRHLQFLPVEAMRQQGPGSESESEAWHPLIDLIENQPQDDTSNSKFQHLPQLPFAHFALPLPPNPSPDTLHSIYLALYRAAVACSEGRNALQETVSTPSEGPAAVAYNLAMTLTTMMICPRRQETAQLPVDVAAAGQIEDHGVVSLNGTILASTLMVKAEGEWNALRGNPEYLSRVLATVGYPKADSQGTCLL
ncbi:hypothetical protein N7495_003083 [Penicillium taxi]|uniref:uncharacterized protein n=1 Tax=Penicillium taxi TaxID=168475 RepID=UPI00254517E2|nr:uncharacterized protein N7495_003083 [Penicillium taxi]KAJ5902555.1 hypothetical protein N7495_003083 [Penicillium taxi]